MVGHWFSGTASLADTSGFTPAGTHNGAAVGGSAGLLAYSTDVPAGFSGQSLDLTAGNVGVRIDNSATGDAGYLDTYDGGLAYQCSVAFWAKGFPGTWAPFVSKNGESSGFQVRRYSTTTTPTFTLRGTPGADDPAGTVNINDGAWHHFAAVWDGTAGTRQLYVDGVLDTGNSLTGDFGPMADPSGSALCLGARDNGGLGSYFTGKLYDVRIYNNPLSQAEVFQLVNRNNTQARLYPGTATLNFGDSRQFSVDIPSTANATHSFTVYVTNSNPAVLSLTGAVGNVLTLVFPAAGAILQDITVTGVGGGTATLTAAGAGLTASTATVIVNPWAVVTENSYDFTWPVETDSLIAGQAPSSIGSGNFQLEGATGTPALTDGALGTVTDKASYATCGNNAGRSVVYTLTNSVNGSSLTNLVVYSGWPDQGRDGQFYNVSYSTVSLPTVFVPLLSISFNPAVSGPSANRVAITAAPGRKLATNVAALKFDFTPQTGGVDYGYSGYAEIIVEGINSAAPPLTRPVVLTQPASAERGSGQDLTLTAVVAGFPAPVFQWKYNGSNIAGATNQTLVLTNLQLTAAGSYVLYATNSVGFTNTTPAILTMFPAQDSITLANPSFEQGYNHTWPHAGTPTGWASSGGSGINDASGPFWDNGGTVDSTYVAWVQANGLLGQPTSGLQVGETYWIQVFANARNNATTPALAVYHSASTAGGAPLISGVTIAPSGGAAGAGNPFIFFNVPFTAAAASGDLNFQKSAPAGGDTTLVLDGVSVIRRSANDVVIANPSFEASGTGQTSPGLVSDKVAGWTTTKAGLRINQVGGPLADNGHIPDGGNVLCLTSGAGVSQTLLGLNPGMRYQLTLSLNSRSGTAIPSALIKIGGNTAFSGTVAPVGGINVYQTLTYVFTAASTDGTLTISNATATATDSTLLVDNVRLLNQSLVITTSNQNQAGVFTPTWTVAPNSLLAGLSPDSSVGDFQLEGCGGTVALTDGAIGPVGGDNTPYATGGSDPTAGQSVIYTLPAYVNGYSLTNITVYSGWVDNGRDAQGYTVYYSTVQTPTVFNLLGSVSYNPSVGAGRPSANRTILSNPKGGLLAMRVVALKFDFNTPPVENGYVGYTEITVQGTNSPALVIPPTVLTQPANATRYVGGAATFSASAAGYPTPQLQWQHNGNNLADATNATLVLNNLQSVAVGSYVMVASNAGGSTNTAAATLTLVPAPTSGYASVVLANNPMGYWRFSDGGGTTAYDYVGGYDAVDPLGQPWQAGPRPPAFTGFESWNTAPFLNGTSQGYASTAQLFNNRSEFTLMGWFKINPSQYPFTNPDGRASLFGQQWAAELSFYQGTNLYFYSGGIPATIFVTSGFTPGIWHFVAAVSDPAAGTTTVYMDGVVAGTGSACPGTVQPYLFSIGKNVSNFPNVPSFFPGSIDEVAAFDHALSESTVQFLYQAGTSFGVTISRQGTRVKITWSMGSLQSATSLSGPWQNEATAVSPWTVTPSGAMKFYRTVLP